MEQPVTTNSKKTRASTADLTAVPLLQAMLDQLRGELATVRVALDNERAAVRALKRDRASELKFVKDEEARKCRDALSDLKCRLEREHEDALQRQKDAVTKTLNAELMRALKAKDAEIKHELAEIHAREEVLKNQVRDVMRASRDAGPAPQSGASNGDYQKLQHEVSSLRALTKQLEDKLQVVVEADRQKAADLRSQHDEHELKLTQMNKTSQQETHRLLEELKSKDRTISQLERQLSLQTGRYEEQRDRLLEKQQEQHPRECDCPEDTCTRARERRLLQRLAELQSTMKKAADAHAQEKKEMIRKLRESEGKSTTGRQPQKNSRNSKRSSPATAECEETVSPDNVATKQLCELEKLRREICEKDRIITELRQTAKEKERKLDQLTNRHRKEQMRQYYKQFMELEPVAEMEEDSGAGEDSPTSSGSPSLSPQPYPADMWTEINNKEYHDTMYSCLLKEHLELQREFQFLQTRLKKELAEPNRMRLRMEHELAASRTHVRELKRMLAEQKGGNGVLVERIASLHAEAHDLREQNELLEFRILELEECHDQTTVKSQSPDTRDVWTDTENDDVSDSGVQSLPNSEDNSDIDPGIHDIKLEIRNEELKTRLLELAKSTSSTTERCCLQQVLALLESYEARVEKLEELHDESCSTVTPDSPSSRNSMDLGGRALKSLPDSTPTSSSETPKFSSRIVATVLPFTDQSSETNEKKPDTRHEGDELKKQLKIAECLQESGIFEEIEFLSQGTQTESSIFHMIKELKTPFESGVVGDLSAEIQKLNQFRERVEEQGTCCANKKFLQVEEMQGDAASLTHPNLKELQYCRERLQLLEDKVQVYESSGDLQAKLLAERLQKEVRLSAQVKDLTTKVAQLATVNRRLEEEKCEFEEAENDTRLKCQKLEVKLIALSEKKSDLQGQLQQERRNMTRLRNSLSECERKKDEARNELNSLEMILNKYEHRNYELEEREIELRHRLEMLEKILPVLLIYNTWGLVQSVNIPRTDESLAFSRSLVRRCPENWQVICYNLRRSLEEGRLNTFLDLRPKVYEVDTIGGDSLNDKVTSCEEQLKSRVEELEAQVVSITSEIQGYKDAAEQYKIRLGELQNQLNGERNTEQVLNVPSISCMNEDCKKKVQTLLDSEADLKRRVAEQERKEKAYMETLQQADDLWSEMENSYKRRISKAEESEAAMREKVRKLEESEAKLKQAFKHEEENDLLLEKLENMEQYKKSFLEKIRVLEAEKKQLLDEISQLRGALQSEQAEFAKMKEQVEGPLKEELLKEKKLSKTLQNEIINLEKEARELATAREQEVKGLKTQLSRTSRDLVDLECTNSELKEEVETLETNVSELKALVEEQKQNEERIMIRMSQTILEKERELEDAKREMRFSQAPSARDELNQILHSAPSEVPVEVKVLKEVSQHSTAEAKSVKESCGNCSCESKPHQTVPEADATKVPELKKVPETCGCLTRPLPVSETAKLNINNSPAAQPEAKLLTSLNHKPVLRRWFHPQKLNCKDEGSPLRQW